MRIKIYVTNISLRAVKFRQIRNDADIQSGAQFTRQCHKSSNYTERDREGCEDGSRMRMKRRRGRSALVHISLAIEELNVANPTPKHNTLKTNDLLLCVNMR